LPRAALRTILSQARPRRELFGINHTGRSEYDRLVVQLGSATEELNRSWYERNTGRRVRDVQRRVRHSAIAWMVATLDGIVEATEAVFESKFMLPWSFSEEAAAEKYMPQLQHNMWVTHLRTSVLSIITGGGKWF
jgi:predicted phage-related endonuclease